MSRTLRLQLSCLLLVISASLSPTEVATSAADDSPPSASPASTGEVVRLNSLAAIGSFQPLNDFAMKGHQIPKGGARELFAAATSGLRIGVWEGGPGILRLTNYSHDEYCLMISGEVVITDEAGHTEAFRTGDSFVIPQGFSGVWDMKTKMRKQYVMVRPAG
jgi:uncharacterized cupin superfamily protein